MKKILIYYNFIIVTLLVFIGFISANTYTQLLIASLFYPLFAYFAFQIFPRRNRAIHLPQTKGEVVPVLKEDKKAIKAKKESEQPSKYFQKLKKEGVDIDRRVFLKLIGSAGLSVFLFSLFTKKAEAAFFGSQPGPGTVALKDTSGTKIDPAIKQPTDGYRITELDDSIPAYYGFTDKDGNWFIMKEDASGAYRYAKGSSNFSTNWTNRASLSYDYFNVVF